ncbi:MAG TPA: hypothetical protein VG838_13115 [Opitutaceae bacterium]|nr:hypothetical protein [Opitutaceae bacterium]
MDTFPAPAGGQTPEELVAQIDELMEEAEALVVGPLAGAAAEEFHALRSRVHHLQTDLARIYGDTRDRIVAAARAADRTVRAHPYESLLIAAGAGVVIGLCLRRGGSQD